MVSVDTPLEQVVLLESQLAQMGGDFAYGRQQLRDLEASYEELKEEVRTGCQKHLLAGLLNEFVDVPLMLRFYCQ